MSHFALPRRAADDARIFATVLVLPAVLLATLLAAPACRASWTGADDSPVLATAPGSSAASETAEQERQPSSREWSVSLTKAEGRALIAADPRDPIGYLQVGRTALSSGDFAAAVKVLEDGRAKAAPSAALLVMLGTAYVNQNRLADAEDVTQAGLALDPAVPGAQLQLGSIYRRLGWYESALECTEKAMTQDPADAAAQDALVYALIAVGRAPAAEKECRGFLAGNSERASLWVALGEALEAQEALKEAFNAYGRALVQDERNAGAHARRGRLYCRFGQFDAAANECRAALELDPEEALAHAYLGIAYSYQGQREAAREHALRAEAAGLRMDSVWNRLAK